MRLKKVAVSSYSVLYSLVGSEIGALESISVIASLEPV